ncbi:uncharacterized protein TNIN_191581 [Trichonephila inaurata madagascariensis]|uniref:Uncharacterized protein n=1 Tax=Trichonephila inaurata madagascariensis TaxID=2747483 RepID=A0A8X6YYQ7_9ARAC|nr:uncharacterized protein TNIN_191581 [Trichonephila inaurata madagascariensis]
MKLRPEKVCEEENVVTPESWNRPVKDFPYLNPVPTSMLHVDILELSKVDIDWKMLTLDRPETAPEIQIFTRIVYLNKVTLKCIVREKALKERAQSIRLRMSGKFKIVPESDNEKVEELTYEFFSRHFGAGERGQAMEEIPKPPPPKESKLPQPNELPSKPVIPKEDTISSIFGSKKRKLKRKKIVKRRKKSKKNKIKKRKTLKKKLGGTSGKKSTPKPKMSSTVKSTKKRNVNTIKYKRQKTDSGKTLVQMLKASERAIIKGKIVKKEKLSDN